MQEGAGVRQHDRGRAPRARRCGCAISTSGSSWGCRSRSRAPSAPATASRSSRARSIEAELAAGTLAEARVEGLELQREILLVRASRPRRDAGQPGVRRVRPRAARVIVRWSLDELPGVLAELGVERPFLVASPRWDARRAAGRPGAGRRSRPTGSRCRRAPTALLAIGGGSAIDTAKAASAATGLPLVSVPTTYSGAEWTPSFGVRTPDRRMVGGGGGAQLAGIVYDVAPHARPAAARDRRARR